MNNASATSGGHGIFYVLIPITAIILAFIVNIIMDNYYQKKLENDTLEIINYIITKDYQTPEEYKKEALEIYSEKEYTESEDYLTIRLGHDYMVFLKYHPINDLTTILNIFKVKWFDKNGYIDDEEINTTMDQKTGVLNAKYIIYLNEYREAEIVPYDENLEKELAKKDQEKYPEWYQTQQY